MVWRMTWQALFRELAMGIDDLKRRIESLLGLRIAMAGHGIGMGCTCSPCTPSASASDCLDIGNFG